MGCTNEKPGSFAIVNHTYLYLQMALCVCLHSLCRCLHVLIPVCICAWVWTQHNYFKRTTINTCVRVCVCVCVWVCVRTVCVSPSFIDMTHFLSKEHLHLGSSTVLTVALQDVTWQQKGFTIDLLPSLIPYSPSKQSCALEIHGANMGAYIKKPFVCIAAIQVHMNHRIIINGGGLLLRRLRYIHSPNLPTHSSLIHSPTYMNLHSTWSPTTTMLPWTMN